MAVPGTAVVTTAIRRGKPLRSLVLKTLEPSKASCDSLGGEGLAPVAGASDGW